jgi:hypothetical protein
LIFLSLHSIYVLGASSLDKFPIRLGLGGFVLVAQELNTNPDLGKLRAGKHRLTMFSFGSPGKSLEALRAS